MPSLKETLQDMLLVAAKGGVIGELHSLDASTFAPEKPKPTISGPMNQSIWYWEKAPHGTNPDDPSYLGEITRLNCWTRWMAEMHGDDELGWMTVCHSVRWSPVKVNVMRGNAAYQLTLPLTEKYVAMTLYLDQGSNPGKGWWPLEADVNNSFMQVFVYDITGKTSSDQPDTVPEDVYSHDDFMPDPAGGQHVAPTLNPGETIDLTVTHKHYICVVTSLVCCGERADFEPGALVGMARVVPHYMIMTNMPVDEIKASVRIQRPAASGYYGTLFENARPPMQHPDMDPEIHAIVVADTNVFRSADAIGAASVPMWDLIFDYVIGVPEGDFVKFNDPCTVVKDEPCQRTMRGAIRLLNYETVGKTARGFVEGALLSAASFAIPALGATVTFAGAVGGAELGSIGLTRPGLRIVHPASKSTTADDIAQLVYGLEGLKKSDLLPRIKCDVIKWPRQAQFDSIHVAPRMRAHLLMGRPGLDSAEYVDSLSNIRMAPFCEHDCFHTHWRWGANWNDYRQTPLLKNRKPISGFGPSSGDAKFAGVGAPYTIIGAPLVPLNQEISIAFESEHVFEYTAKMKKDVVPGIWQAVYHHGSAYAVSIVAKGQVNFLVNGLTGASVDSVPPQFSEFYWTLRYQDTIDGALSRIEIDDADLMRLMGL
jgi:hypothetical protein